MHDLPIHTTDTCPPQSKLLLERVRRRVGFIPNIFGALATSPQLLEAYGTVDDLLAAAPFSSAERQAVLLAISFENACDYCLAAHTGAGRRAGLTVNDLVALRLGNELADPRLNALVTFTREVVRQRGIASPAQVGALLDAGWARRTPLDVILAIALKTISNYTNHLVNTPLDTIFEADRWNDRPNQPPTA